jgi:broad specificity phosphatase PhoE
MSDGRAPRKLRLLRHCESLSNAGVATLDARTLPLSKQGRDMAKEIAATWLPASAPNMVVVSPYTRAQQTAQPLLERFPQVKVEHLPVQEFTYLEQPATPTTPEQRRPLADAFWARADVTELQRGAESFFQFWGRVLAFHDQAIRSTFLDIVVVTHGGFMVAFDALCSQPDAAVDACLMRRVGKVFRQVPFANGEVVEYELDATGLRWCRRLGS